MSNEIYPLYNEGSIDKLHLSNQKDLEATLSTKVASYDKDHFDEVMREIIQADEDPSDTYCFVDYNSLYYQMHKWFTLFKGIQPFYAVKALPDKDIVKIMGDTGCMCFDCASMGEIELVLNAGVKPNHIIYANPVKPVEHLKYAKNHNILYMTLDNIEEVDKISKIYNTNNAQLIVRIGVDDSHSIIALGSKFGCSVDEGKEIINHCKELNQNVVGVSFHVGTGCDDLIAWSNALKSVKELFDYGKSCGYNMKYVDLGGGWPGIERNIKCEDIIVELRKSLDSLFDEKDIVIFAEPGRYFCESIVNICTYITQVKSGNGKLIYRQNEGVFGVFKDHVLVSAEFVPEVLISKNIDGEKVSCKLYGPTSNKKDVIMEDLQLPKLNVNDWICYKRYGSYTVSLSSVDISHNIVFLIEKTAEET